MAISGNDIIAAVEKYRGVPYSQRNPQSPATGLDCSGVVQLAMSNLGMSIPRTTTTQLAAAKTGGPGTDIGTNLADAMPGDVLHYVGHEEVWLGNGQVFSESTFGTTADVRTKTPWPIIGIVRYWDTVSGSGIQNLSGGSGGTGTIDANSIEQAIDQLPDIPFGPIKPIIKFVVTPVVDITNFIKTVGNPGFWERVTLAFLGAIILALALYAMAKRKPVITITKQMVQKGASVASPA